MGWSRRGGCALPALPRTNHTRRVTWSVCHDQALPTSTASMSWTE